MQVNLSDAAPLCAGQGKALAAASSHYLQLLMPALAFLSVSTCLQRYLQAQVRPVKHLCGRLMQSRACHMRTQVLRFQSACQYLWNFNPKRKSYGVQPLIRLREEASTVYLKKLGPF